MRYIDNVKKLIKEEATVIGLFDGLLLIKREEVWSDGARLGGDFMFAPQIASWLADQLELAADDKLSRTTHDVAPDHLKVFVRGGERGEPINIHVHNDRDATAPHGRTYTMSGLSPYVARKLAANLRACPAPAET